MNKFRERVKELRTERKMSQADLAEILKCTPNAISHWENRGKEPDYDMLVKIVKTLKTSADYLLGLKDSE